jgi:putative transposase
MPRRLRFATGGYVYHALNRAVGRARLFHKPADYDAFERVLAEARQQVPVRLLGYCVLPNHWHLVLWPREDDELSAFLHWLTMTHTVRWHAHRHTTGTGPVYQGRFKSFPVQDDDHYLTVLRYVERNPVRAGLVADAAAWRWSSLGHRLRAGDADLPLDPGPVGLPADWPQRVTRPETAAELAAVRRSAVRGTPFGDAAWTQATAKALGLESTLRPRGRPRKAANDAPSPSPDLAEPERGSGRVVQ